MTAASLISTLRRSTIFSAARRVSRASLRQSATARRIASTSVMLASAPASAASSASSAFFSDLHAASHVANSLSVSGRFGMRSMKARSAVAKVGRLPATDRAPSRRTDTAGSDSMASACAGSMAGGRT